MESKNATMQVTGAVSWRREGLKYKKNEVYLDIVESINVLMTAKGVCACAACDPLPVLTRRRGCRRGAAQRRLRQDPDEVFSDGTRCGIAAQAAGC